MNKLILQHGSGQKRRRSGHCRTLGTKICQIDSGTELIDESHLSAADSQYRSRIADYYMQHRQLRPVILFHPQKYTYRKRPSFAIERFWQKGYPQFAQPATDESRYDSTGDKAIGLNRSVPYYATDRLRNPYPVFRNRIRSIQRNRVQRVCFS